MKKGPLSKPRESMIPKAPERVIKEEQKILRPNGPRNLSRHKYTNDRMVFNEKIKDMRTDSDLLKEEKKQNELKENKALLAEIEKLKIRINTQAHTITDLRVSLVKQRKLYLALREENEKLKISISQKRMRRELNTNIDPEVLFAMQMGNFESEMPIYDLESMQLALALAESRNASGEPNPDTMTYEELLALEERIGKVEIGLSEAEIESLPPQLSQGGEICTICQSEMEKNEEIKKLHKCGHSYHSECIHEWLKSRKICPVCLESVI